MTAEMQNREWSQWTDSIKLEHMMPCFKQGVSVHDAHALAQATSS